MKNIRNNLKKHGFKIDRKLVSWDNIRKFYYADCECPICLAPMPTSKHIEIPPFTAHSVKRATQVMSHSVASGMQAMAQWNLLLKEAFDTAMFLGKMDQFFITINSSNLSSTAVMGHAFSGISGHKEFLLDKQKWVSKVVCVSGHKLPCLEGWKLAVNCLLQLWEDMKHVWPQVPHHKQTQSGLH